jgi:hypothetical protein
MANLECEWPAVKVEASEPAADSLAQVAATAIDEPARVDAIAHEHSAGMAPALEDAPSVEDTESADIAPARGFARRPTRRVVIAAYLMSLPTECHGFQREELKRMAARPENNLPKFSDRMFDTALAIAFTDNPKHAKDRKCAQDRANISKFK